MAFLFKNKQKKEEDPEVLAAYNQALKKRRIQNAETAAIRDADALANRKPFYQKVVNAAAFLGKDLMQGASQVNPDALFTFDEPHKPKRRRRKQR